MASPNEIPAPTKRLMAGCQQEPCSDSSGHVVSRFVIYQEPGKIPKKKGPFLSDEQVENMLIEMEPHHHADTIYTVAEITHDHDLWLTCKDEFLAFLRVCRMVEIDDQNS